MSERPHEVIYVRVPAGELTLESGQLATGDDKRRLHDGREVVGQVGVKHVSSEGSPVVA
ncbi:MAG: hypothetical protein JWL62_3806, partial [Hyphomicrobiales bacterium]|nr:hypothetical protein [Hyphomicrobiales bacterium]